MKKLLLASVLAIVSTSANAWTDINGHWIEGPIPPGYTYPHPAYNPVAPGYYPPPPAYYGPPVVVVPPPTDAQVIAGTIFGIASMFTHRGGW